MKIERTNEFTYNVRRGTVPELTEEQYEALLSGQEIEVSKVSRKYLLLHNFARKPGAHEEKRGRPRTTFKHPEKHRLDTYIPSDLWSKSGAGFHKDGPLRFSFHQSIQEREVRIDYDVSFDAFSKAGYRVKVVALYGWDEKLNEMRENPDSELLLTLEREAAKDLKQKMRNVRTLFECYRQGIAYTDKLYSLLVKEIKDGKLKANEAAFGDWIGELHKSNAPAAQMMMAHLSRRTRNRVEQKIGKRAPEADIEEFLMLFRTKTPQRTTLREVRDKFDWPIDRIKRAAVAVRTYMKNNGGYGVLKIVNRTNTNETYIYYAPGSG